MRKFLSDDETANRYGISRQHVWKLVKQGRLPKPVKISPGCARWDVEDLDALDAARKKEAA